MPCIVFFATAERKVEVFMSYIRNSFSRIGVSITPKLHILEEHVVPWMRKWQFGLGFMGEQGAESIHARFNTLQRTYSNIKNRTERLKYILKEHHLQVSPYTVEQRPQKRKKIG
jgi:hypothetical protein